MVYGFVSIRLCHFQFFREFGFFLNPHVKALSHGAIFLATCNEMAWIASCKANCLTNGSLKKLLHSLRTSITREIKRSQEQEDYESKWKFFKLNI